MELGYTELGYSVGKMIWIQYGVLILAQERTYLFASLLKKFASLLKKMGKPLEMDKDGLSRR